MTTSDDAFSKTELTDASDVAKGENDIDGPFAIGVEAVKEITAATAEGSESTVTSEATMIVIGCEDFFTDDASSMVSGANQMIFNNIMGSFSDNEVSVSIPVKSYEISSLMVPQVNIVAIGINVAVVLPFGCLIAGFVIWFRRRKR